MLIGTEKNLTHEKRNSYTQKSNYPLTSRPPWKCSVCQWTLFTNEHEEPLGYKGSFQASVLNLEAPRCISDHDKGPPSEPKHKVNKSADQVNDPFAAALLIVTTIVTALLYRNEDQLGPSSTFWCDYIIIGLQHARRMRWLLGREELHFYLFTPLLVL